MEYFNYNSPEYTEALKRGNGYYKIRLELLSDDESVIGEITQDLSFDMQGQITINYEQIVRRSCSLTLIDVDSKYLPRRNSPFWINRKFKLWVGLAVIDDIYWFSQGVYYTLSATSSEHNLSIEGVDKGAALDGTLKLNMTEYDYIINRGDNVNNAIQSILALNMNSVPLSNSPIVYTNDKPVDPIMPIVDIEYYTQTLNNQIQVDANNYLSEIFTSLADGYGAECYYDTDGHFVFTHYIESAGYQYAPKIWDFNDLSSFFEDVNYNYTYDGENVVTYYTNSSDAETTNVAWTAYNTNPLSPLCVTTGIRRAPSQEITYYRYYEDEELNTQQMIADCRSAANHYLIMNSLMGMQLTFNCPIIPHIDVNKAIGISDRKADIDSEIFIIQSVTIPLSADKMSISATNINWLPNDMSFEGEAQIIGRS